MKRQFIYFAVILFGFLSCKTQQLNLIAVNEGYKEFRDKNIQDLRKENFDLTFEDRNDSILVTGTTEAPDLLEAFYKELKQPIINNVVVLPNPELDYTWGLINTSSANLRKQPLHRAEMLTQSIMGTPVKILNKKGGWYYIKTPDGYNAWVDYGGIAPLSNQAYEQWKKSPRVLVVDDKVLIKDLSGENIISDVTLGSILLNLGQNENNVLVELPDGRKGALPITAVTDFAEWEKSVQPLADNIIAQAEEFIGKPYLWGGTSSKGMDCSGFTKTVYYMNGLILERDASQQIRLGDIISGNDYTKLKKGDLMFIGESINKITHVALYRGDGKYIHAAGLVRENSLDPTSPIYDEYVAKNWVASRRIINGDFDPNPLRIDKHSWYN